MLPAGQQVKREVDFMLDEIFNTMTPMMFHMREIIFVTFNKVSLEYVWRKTTCRDTDTIMFRPLNVIFSNFRRLGTEIIKLFFMLNSLS